MSNPYADQGAYLIVLLIFAIFVFVDTADDPRRLVSAFGILVLIGLGFIFSKHPGNLSIDLNNFNNLFHLFEVMLCGAM